MRKAIAEGKKILVLINPPYAEAGTGVDSGNKEGVATTKVSKNMPDYGYATRELFTQFLARITQEIPNATLAMFSKLKYVNAPNFEIFREKWNAEYLGGFIVHSMAFDGLKGEFPIGFLVWKTNQNALIKSNITEIITDVLDKNTNPIGEKKFFNLPNNSFLNSWAKRPKTSKLAVIPLKNAVFQQLEQ